MKANENIGRDRKYLDLLGMEYGKFYDIFVDGINY